MNSPNFLNSGNSATNINQNMNAPPTKPAPPPIPASILTSQRTSGAPAPMYLSASSSAPSISPSAVIASTQTTKNKNAMPAGPDLNAKAADVYKELQSGLGRVSIGDDPKLLDKINEFLTTYPQRNIKRNKDGQITPDTWVDMSVRDLFQQSIQTLIDIINDLSETISDRSFMSPATYRRKLFDIFVRPDRRLYVGLILIFFSFVLYFIDSAA